MRGKPRDRNSQCVFLELLRLKKDKFDENWTTGLHEKEGEEQEDNDGNDNEDNDFGDEHNDNVSNAGNAGDDYTSSCSHRESRKVTKITRLNIHVKKATRTLFFHGIEEFMCTIKHPLF